MRATTGRVPSLCPRIALRAATLLVGVLGCFADPAPSHHPLAATIQSPCDHERTFRSAARDRLNQLRRCGAIDDEERSCLGSQLDFLGDDVARRCEVGRLSYANIAGEQRRRYATCIVPFDPGLIDCSLFSTDLGCGDRFCDPERSLSSVSAASPTLVAGSPEAILAAGSSPRDTLAGWRLPDRRLREYLKQRAGRCG